MTDSDILDLSETDAVPRYPSLHHRGGDGLGGTEGTVVGTDRVGLDEGFGGVEFRLNWDALRRLANLDTIAWEYFKAP